MYNDAQQRPPQRHRIGVGVEETRHQVTRKAHSVRSTTPSLKNALYKQVGTTSKEGRSQFQDTRLNHMMMSAAVLARRLIGTC